ncbi:MAG: hypothetical protein ACRYHQ_31820, partial [Janthinobacterium lividum]
MQAGPRSPGKDDGELIRAVEEQSRAPDPSRFAPVLQARFDRDTAASRGHQAQLAILIGIGLFDLFLLSDAFLTPDVYSLALILRLGVVTPLGLAAAAWIGRPRPQAWRDGVLAVGSVLATGCAVGLAALSQAPQAGAGLASLVLAATFLTLLSPMRLPYAAAAAVLCLGCTAVGLAEWSPIPTVAVAGAVFVQACLAGAGLVVNLRLHQAERRAYLPALCESLQDASMEAANRSALELTHSD